MYIAHSRCGIDTFTLCEIYSRHIVNCQTINVRSIIRPLENYRNSGKVSKKHNQQFLLTGSR